MLSFNVLITSSVLCVATSQVQAPVNSVREITSSEHAYQILSTSESFAPSGVSIDGRPAPEHFAVVYLVRHKSGTSQLFKLLKSDNWHARLYAMCGLYYKDKGHFLVFAKLHKDSKIEVSQFSGCLIHPTTVGQLIYSEKPGIPRIVCKPSYEDIDHASNRIPLSAREITSDILGGGIPANIMKLGSQ
jgi:hypothetical protein